jgi:hypothetical protein
MFGGSCLGFLSPLAAANHCDSYLIAGFKDSVFLHHFKLNKNVKIMFFVHSVKACGRAEVYVHSFVTYVLDKVVVSFMPRPLYPLEKLPVSIV